MMAAPAGDAPEGDLDAPPAGTPTAPPGGTPHAAPDGAPRFPEDWAACAPSAVAPSAFWERRFVNVRPPLFERQISPFPAVTEA